MAEQRLEAGARGARQDARRMLRHPLLALGVGLSLLVFWNMRQISLEGAAWSGEEWHRPDGRLGDVVDGGQGGA